jgi:hypothetical protein
LKISITKLEAWKIIHIIRAGEIIPSQEPWAKNFANVLEDRLVTLSPKNKSKGKTSGKGFLKMVLKVTKWEAQRIIDILRCRKIVPSQFAWADETANKIEIVLRKLKEDGSWGKKQ